MQNFDASYRQVCQFTFQEIDDWLVQQDLMRRREYEAEVVRNRARAAERAMRALRSGRAIEVPREFSETQGDAVLNWWETVSPRARN